MDYLHSAIVDVTYRNVCYNNDLGLIQEPGSIRLEVALVSDSSHTSKKLGDAHIANDLLQAFRFRQSHHYQCLDDPSLPPSVSPRIWEALTTFAMNQ